MSASFLGALNTNARKPFAIHGEQDLWSTDYSARLATYSSPRVVHWKKIYIKGNKNVTFSRSRTHLNY